MKDLRLLDFKPKSKLVTKKVSCPVAKFPVVDFHIHLRRVDMDAPVCDMAALVEQMKKHGVVHTVNLDGWWGKALDETLEKTKGYEDYITTFGTIDATKIDEPDFEERTAKEIRDAYQKGMRGIKFLKTLGLQQQDKFGNYIRPDDERLKVIWKTAAELDIPILIHIADPIAFFTPLDEYNERYEELCQHPGWMFNDPKFYRYEQLMEMQQNLLKNNPDTTFIVAHVGSCGENLQFVADCLDRFPNMYVDIAARISELGRQPYTARDFMIKYQDRILFGVDYILPCSDIEKELEQYHYYFEFMETKNEYFPANDGALQGRWMIYGVYLPDEVLKKIYYQNAEKILKRKFVKE